LEDLVSFGDGLAWVGFTASTGDDSENHDILNWAFHDSGDMVAVRQLSARVSAGGQTNRQNSPVANTERLDTLVKSEPQLIGLPVVDSKGQPGQPQIGLPSAVGLTHQVYASTDLVNWTLVTNLNFYFNDPAAPDYDHRFYKFLGK